jgi:hypothetical protein
LHAELFRQRDQASVARLAGSLLARPVHHAIHYRASPTEPYPLRVD